jgi:hypothetical protein
MAGMGATVTFSLSYIYMINDKNGNRGLSVSMVLAVLSHGQVKNR